LHRSTYEILYTASPHVVVLVVWVFAGFLGELGDGVDFGRDLRFCCLHDGGDCIALVEYQAGTHQVDYISASYETPKSCLDGVEA